MKRLVLLRHAKSSWDDDSLSDHERPLATRGLRDAPRMGERLALRGIDPDAFVTSTARRARQTADLVAAALAAREFEIRVEADIYHASPGELSRIVESLEDRWQEVVLVGHNPGFTLLANTLLPTFALGNLPTAGTVAIDSDAANWRTFPSSSLRLAFFDYPKNTEAPTA